MSRRNNVYLYVCRAWFDDHSAVFLFVTFIGIVFSHMSS